MGHTFLLLTLNGGLLVVASAEGNDILSPFQHTGDSSHCPPQDEDRGENPSLPCTQEDRGQLMLIPLCGAHQRQLSAKENLHQSLACK